MNAHHLARQRRLQSAFFWGMVSLILLMIVIQTLSLAGLLAVAWSDGLRALLPLLQLTLALLIWRIATCPLAPAVLTPGQGYQCRCCQRRRRCRQQRRHGRPNTTRRRGR